MAAVAIFCVPRDSALVNPVDRFLDEQYVKTRVLAQGGASWGFRNINILVFTPKIAKEPNLWAFKCVS